MILSFAPFAHIPVALGIQFVSWWIGWSLGATRRVGLWIGVFAGSAVCVMREITQREYQWIEAFGSGRRANMPGYAGLEVWQWNRHSVEETLTAMAAVLLVALIAGRRGRPG